MNRLEKQKLARRTCKTKLDLGARIRRLRAEGMGTRAIAERLCISPSSVVKYGGTEKAAGMEKGGTQ